MDVKKLVMAGVASTIGMFILAGVWHSLLLGDFYATEMAEVNRVDRQMGLIFVGYLLLGFLMAYMYPKGYQGGSPVKEGARFGALMGLVAHGTTGIIYLGVWKLTVLGIGVDVAYHIVEGAIGGVIVASIYGTAKK